MSTDKDSKLASVLKIKSSFMHSAGTFLRKHEFIEILPVILAPVTDPLHHETYDGTVDYYGRPYKLTKSMILHKQVALRTVPKIFCFSPNVRMEPASRAPLGRYLAEFVQLDLEVRDSTRDDIISLGEGLITYILSEINDTCRKELDILDRNLPIPQAPFDRITYEDAANRFGEGFDDALSASISKPTWVIDFPHRVREFYDKEDPNRPGTLLDMDLIYPQGYGEALSGGEREHELARVRDRLTRNNIPLDTYQPYLKEVTRGIPQSVGFGIGVERLTRYICGLDDLSQARLFAKLPGRQVSI